MRTLGIDMASQPAKTGIACVVWTDGHARVRPGEEACDLASRPIVIL